MKVGATSLGIVIWRNGDQAITAGRDYLRKRLPYEDEPFFLDELTVEYNWLTGRIHRAVARYDYRPERSGYFRGHLGGLFPGLGGDGEFMVQAAAGAVLLTAKGSNPGKFVLDEIRRLKIHLPVKGQKSLVAVAMPIYRFGNPKFLLGFKSEVHLASRYNNPTFSRERSLVATMELTGRRIS